MPRHKQLIIIIITICLTVCSAHLTHAQDSDATRTVRTLTPTVTVATAPDLVRFTAPSNVVRTQLEVFSDSGQLLSDVTTKGNVLDWTLQDSVGQRLRPDAYLCLVTVKNLSGAVSQRVGTVRVLEKGAALEVARVSPAQLQAVGPIEEQAALSVLTEDDGPAMMVLGHDGRNGQLTSTSGALTFRIGNFFSGRDREQMRLTEDGRLGIGTKNPKFTLDVAGAIRARGGLIFDDGTALTSTGRAGRVNSLGDVVPNAAGTGSQNFIAKWTETGGAGTLGNTGIFEGANGFIGIGTTTPAHPFVVRRNNGTIGVHSVGELFVDRDNNTRSASLTVGTGGTLKWMFGMPEGTDGFQVFDLINFQSRFFVHPTNGNIGIGTAAPAAGHKLDVAGTINTSTQYNIGGSRVLSVAGSNNVFVGTNAGNANTMGSANSFFGRDAGKTNTTGENNSFFGASAGLSNTTARNNSFFGRDAGRASTGDNNSLFGASAGFSNTTGAANSFFGASAGFSNTGGAANSFFGADAGFSNTTGFINSFFGISAGRSNTTGTDNSFFGEAAGYNNTTGNFNSFFGARVAYLNATGIDNSFFGFAAGQHNTTGSDNVFLGMNAGNTNTTGNNNTIIGRGAGLASGDLTFATAIGADAVVSNSNSIVLGRNGRFDTVRIPGNLVVTGTVSKGGGSFKIDHPLDPLNKTLSHSFVESPDMMNIYNGNIMLDARGRGTVTLPAYFEALNAEFRYQLTAIGAPGPNLYIAAEIKGNQFKIAGGRPRMRVSWQVTGVRHDTFANANRITVEEEKPADERGTFLHPGAFDPEIAVPTRVTASAESSTTAAVRAVRVRPKPARRSR